MSETDPGDEIDPVLAKLNAQHSAPDIPLNRATLPQRRAATLAARAGMAGAATAKEIEDQTRTLAGLPVHLRRIRPQKITHPGQILYVHGGGWVMCDLETHRGIMIDLADAAGAELVGIDYALAPERPCPVAHDQIVEAARALMAEAPDRPLILSGDSAGANLALHAALTLRDTGAAGGLGPLLLWYGCYLRGSDSESHRRYGGGDYGLTTESMLAYWDFYLSGGDDSGDLTGADLSGLPPIFAGIARCDCLADDSRWLVEGAQAAGGTAELFETPGANHGFLHESGNWPPALEQLRAAAAFLDRMS